MDIETPAYAESYYAQITLFIKAVDGSWIDLHDDCYFSRKEANECIKSLQDRTHYALAGTKSTDQFRILIDEKIEAYRRIDL